MHPMSTAHQDMLAGGCVSIWLGDMADEDELDAYLGEDFASDFGFDIHEPNGPEYDIQDSTDVRSLLEGFSQWRQFVGAAVAAAADAGITEATTAVVFYSLKYDPDLANNPVAPLRFIGTVPLSAA